MWIVYLLFIPALLWALGWLFALSLPVLAVVAAVAVLGIIVAMPVALFLAINDNDPLGWIMVSCIALFFILLIVHSDPFQKTWAKIKPYVW